MANLASNILFLQVASLPPPVNAPLVSVLSYLLQSQTERNWWPRENSFHNVISINKSVCMAHLTRSNDCYCPVNTPFSNTPPKSSINQLIRVGVADKNGTRVCSGEPSRRDLTLLHLSHLISIFLVLIRLNYPNSSCQRCLCGSGLPCSKFIRVSVFVVAAVELCQ